MRHQHDHDYPVSHVQFTSDGRRLISVAGNNQGGDVCVWDLATGRPATLTMHHAKSIRRVEVSSDGRLILTSGDDGVAQVWDLATGQPVSPPLRQVGPVEATFAFGGRRIFATCVKRPDSLLAGSGFGNASDPIREWALSPPHLLAGDLLSFAKLTSGRTIDDLGELRPLASSEQKAILDDLRRYYPPDFAMPTTKARDWHDREATRAESELDRLTKLIDDLDQGDQEDSDVHWRRARSRYAALWHLNRLMGLEPEPRADIHFRRGRLRAGLCRWREAAADFRRAADLRPDRWEVWYNLGTCYRALDTPTETIADTYDKACRLLAKVRGPKGLNLQGREASAWEHLGRMHSRAGRWPEAIEALSKSIALRPLGPERARYHRGLALAAMGRWDRSLADLDASDPLHQSGKDRLHRAVAEAALGRWRAALTDALKAATLIGSKGGSADDPTRDVPLLEDIVEWDALPIYNPDDFYAWYLIGGEKYASDPIASLSRSIDLNPDFMPAWLELGRARVRADRWDLALADFTRAVALAPNSADARFELSRAHLKLGRLDESLADLAALRDEKLMTVSKEDVGKHWHALARALRARGDLAKAIDAYGGALSLEPTKAEYHWERGELLLKMNRTEEALAEFKAPTRYFPGNPAFWEYLARKSAELGQWKEAAAAFEKNIPDEKDWADCWYMESLARLAVGDGEGYRSMWAFRDRASKRLSADGTDWTRLGSPLFAWSCALAPGALDDPARVVEIAGRALDAHPGDAPCLAASGAALYRAGRFEEAASRLDRAIAVEGDADSAASWRLFLAMAQHRLGRHDAARASLAKAIEQIEREGKKNDTDTQAREPSWTTRVEQRLLLREAEASVGDKARFDGGPLPDP